MDIDDFEDKVDRWGEDVAAWPEPSRTYALALLQSSPDAREILAEASVLRAALGPAPAVRASDDLKARIFAGAGPSEIAPRSASRPVSAGWLAHLLPNVGGALRPILVLSACFLLGVFSSFLTAEPQGEHGRVGLAGSLLEELR